MKSSRTWSAPPAAAWNDPAKGGELARAQFDRGVDVVFAVAGGSGMGALQTAKEKGKLAIGVDSNQNYLHPGTMLTSMVKRVDVAIYDSFMADRRTAPGKPGVTYKGLKEGGVDWVLDKDNRAVVTPEIEKSVNEAERQHHQRQDQGHRLPRAAAPARSDFFVPFKARRAG